MKKSKLILAGVLFFLISCEKETVQSNERIITYSISTESASVKQSIVLNNDTLTVDNFTALPGDVLKFNVNQFPSGSLSIVVRQDGERIAQSFTESTTLSKTLLIE